MTHEAQFPDFMPADLRRYMPALSHASRVLEDEARRLRSRCEMQEVTATRRSREELEDLRALIGKPTDQP